MYLDFYHLKKEPFSLSPDPSFLFISEAHKEALAHLRYGLIQKKGFVLITGEVGTGKTTLLNYLIHEIPQELKVAYISNPKLTREEFFYFLAQQFKLGPIKNKAEFIFKFIGFLEDAFKKDHNVVLIVDEVHCLDEDILEEIRLLSNLETPKSKLLNIILVGQPEFEEIINKKENRALRQRINLRYVLKPLNANETAEYIKFRLRKAGAWDVDIFNKKAINAIFRYSNGIPRLINLLADHALLTGYVKGTKIIGNKIIKECAIELGLASSIERGIHNIIPERGNRLYFLIVLLCVLVILGWIIYNTI